MEKKSMPKTLSLNTEPKIDPLGINTEEIAEIRANSETELRVQVYEYSDGESPNPPNPKVGQIWISKKKIK